MQIVRFKNCGRLRVTFPFPLKKTYTCTYAHILLYLTGKALEPKLFMEDLYVALLVACGDKLSELFLSWHIQGLSATF
jgi:hypothetical protein